MLVHGLNSRQSLEVFPIHEESAMPLRDFLPSRGPGYGVP
jgi:hypothetical protein